MHQNPHSPLTPYLLRRPATDTRPRLFCFHHAGGSASVFTLPQNVLSAEVNVIGVQLPGRELRLHEPWPDDMAALVAELDERLDEFLTEPYSFYGHSMGALVARDLAERRRARGAETPVRLLVGACRAPHLTAAFASAYAQPDEELRKNMLAVGGLSEELLNYPDWLEAAISLTRNDLRLCAGRVHAESDPPPWAIDAFHGAGDPVVSETDVAAWAAHTGAEFAMHRLPGGHFFLIGEASRQFTAKVASILLGTPVRPRSLR